MKRILSYKPECKGHFWNKGLHFSLFVLINDLILGDEVTFSLSSQRNDRGRKEAVHVTLNFHQPQKAFQDSTGKEEEEDAAVIHTEKTTLTTTTAGARPKTTQNKVSLIGF